MHENLPDTVVIGGGGQHPGAGFMGPKFAPLPLGDPNSGLPISTLEKGVDESAFKKRLDMMGTFDQRFNDRFGGHDEVAAYNEFYDNSLNLMKSEDLDVFDLSKEPDQ